MRDIEKASKSDAEKPDATSNGELLGTEGFPSISNGEPGFAYEAPAAIDIPTGSGEPRFYRVVDKLPSTQAVSISEIRKQVEALSTVVDAFLIRKDRPLGPRENADVKSIVSLLKRISALSLQLSDDCGAVDPYPYGWFPCVMEGCKFMVWCWGRGGVICADCDSRAAKKSKKSR